MPPVLPSSEEAGTYDEEKTTVLMRAVYAYNRYHVRRTMKEDRKWFSSWTDQPIHMHQPLVIRRPERKEDLLSYVAPWRKDEAVTSFLGTGTYKGGGNVFWLNPFVAQSHQNIVAIAGDPPLYSAVLDAAENFVLSKVLQEGVVQGRVSAGKEARIKFPHTFTVYGYSLATYEADHFDGSLPLVSGHVALWGYHFALMKALVSGDMAHVAVLVQAALCATIEGVIVDSDEKLAIISMERSENVRQQYEYLKNSFPAFARKLTVALAGVKEKTMAEKLTFCAANKIIYNGSRVYKTMLTAAQNCSERLDEKAFPSLRLIERHRNGGKTDLSTSFSTLNRVLQICAKEVEKTNAVMWGSVTVHDLVNHVLHYIVWALDHDKIDGCGVTHAWLEKSKSGDNCGAMRLVHGKVYLRIVIESLVNDLPDTSVAKTQFLRVLSPFDSYASFSNILGKKKSGASSPAASAPAAADAEEIADHHVADVRVEEALDEDEPFTKFKQQTAGVANELLDFLFDFFGQIHDKKLGEFLTSDANANKPVCQIGWEEWRQADLIEIRRTLGLHRMTVPATDGSEMPAASTRGLKRSMSATGDDLAARSGFLRISAR